MKNRYLFGLLLLTATVVLSGCKTVNPVMPVESYKYVPVKPQTSIVNLHADLEVAKLEAMLNDQVDSLLYEDNSYEDNGGDNMMMKAWKNGRITLAFENDELAWEIPLRLAIKKTVAVMAFNLPFVDAMEATGEIKIRFKTKLSVNRDWSIQTATSPNGYDWVRKPSVKIAGVTISVTAMANVLLSNNIDSYSKEVDKAIADNFDFRKYAEKGWQMMFEPFKLPGDYNAWLSFNPYSVSLLPVKGSDGLIHFRTAVTSDVECLLDQKPQSGKVTALPSIQPLELPGDSFRINLMTDIPYSTIERMTLEETRDSVYTFGNRKISFETFRVYGSNGKMAIETKVRGSINGTMYLTGTPVFNAADTTLRVRDLKFDLKTKNVMMKSAEWLFNGKIERTLTKAIAIPFNENIREVEDQLVTFFNHYQLGYGFEINGKLDRMTVSDLYLTPESVKANVVFSGNLSIGIGELVLHNGDK